MGKTAFIFPGQGAQYIGMGQEFYRNHAGSREIFELASEATGLDLAALCFEENDQLNITEYTQIAMLTTEVAMLQAVLDEGVSPDVTGGLSLGEYSALVASGVMDFAECAAVVRKRGIYMQDAVPAGEGAMAAILAMDAERILRVLSEVDGPIGIANYNCPGQIVISGRTDCVEKACALLKEAGAKRCIMLNVSGPFHSPMLAGAGERLAEELAHVTIHDIAIPYVTNVTGKMVSDASQVKDLLAKQVSNPVRWIQCVETMIADGVDYFVEIGPGKTLSSFVKKISRDVTVVNVDQYADMEKLHVRE